MISYAYHIYVYSCFWYCHSSLTFRNFTVIWPSNPHAKSLQCFLHYFSCPYSLFSSTIPVVLTCIRTILCTPSFHNAYYKFLWVVICGSGPSWLVLEVMRAQHTVPPGNWQKAIQTDILLGLDGWQVAQELTYVIPGFNSIPIRILEKLSVNTSRF